MCQFFKQTEYSCKDHADACHDKGDLHVHGLARFDSRFQFRGRPCMICLSQEFDRPSFVRVVSYWLKERCRPDADADQCFARALPDQIVSSVEFPRLISYESFSEMLQRIPDGNEREEMERRVTA